MNRNCYDRDNDINNIFTENNIDIDMYNQPAVPPMMQPEMTAMQAPIIEPMQEQVVNRTIMHEVQHICPMRTRIINHHVFKHTYQPSYSCCEENVCSEIQEKKCF